ncbi:hypothetical protein [Paenibacillus gorillae]|uniref:hypothetical protein n=1 Tax=Paenibacillus gorillae TaxID=1243662 RepID=UPI0004B721E9|nr:hypothetical protein [Paenibacillus gorillae]
MSIRPIYRTPRYAERVLPVKAVERSAAYSFREDEPQLPSVWVQKPRHSIQEREPDYASYDRSLHLSRLGGGNGRGRWIDQYV